MSRASRSPHAFLTFSSRERARAELRLLDANRDVTLAADGHEGMRQAVVQQWGLINLDLRPPGSDGLTICRALRREQVCILILMLTSKSSKLDRVPGLELGADDYVTKPPSCRR